MATYGFYERYVASIKVGTKDQTIRRVRKTPPVPGEKLRLKCKQKLFGTARITEVFKIKFWPFEPCLLYFSDRSNPPLKDAELERFASRDGFETFNELFKELRKYSSKTDWNEFLVIRWENFQEITQETAELF